MADTPVPSTSAEPAGRSAKDWLGAIEKAEKDNATWTERSRKIERIYLDDRNETARLKRQYALLWANVSVLQPAVYAKPPQPVVTRRFSDRDPVARAVSEVVKRWMAWREKTNSFQ